MVAMVTKTVKPTARTNAAPTISRKRRVWTRWSCIRRSPENLIAPIGRLRSSAGVARECANDSLHDVSIRPSIHDLVRRWFPRRRGAGRVARRGARHGVPHPVRAPFLRTYYERGSMPLGHRAHRRRRARPGPRRTPGAVDPAQHVHAMLRRHGGHSACASSPGRDPSAAGARPSGDPGRRYARGVVRMLARRLRRNDTSESPSTEDGRDHHVLVAADAQGSGRVANSSSSPYSRPVQPAPRNRAVTPPDQAARAFYERLGWESDGEVTSRSGEKFVRYRLTLGAARATRSGALPVDRAPLVGWAAIGARESSRR